MSFFDDALKAELIAAAKAEGLNVAEESIKGLVGFMFKAAELIVPKVNVGAAAIVLPVLELAKPKVFEAIDKIDGKQG